MTKPKPKKTCEFEAMRDITEILAPFRLEERQRIVEAVNAKLDARPEPKPRVRKPKANGAHQSGGRENGLIAHISAPDAFRK